MTPKRRRFVDEYMVDLNAAKAARRAGYVGAWVRTEAHRLLKLDSIQDYLQKRMAERAARVEITQDEVLKRWTAIARADPNEIVQHRRVCCRHCWGEGNAYQWVDEAEFIRAWQKAKTEADAVSKDCPVPVDMLLPSHIGGYGFDRRREPNDECPKCSGEGFGEVYIQDTRHLNSEALPLYAGVKKTKDGIEVLTHSQPKADEMLARHLGLLNDKLDVNARIKRDVSDMTDEELLAIAARTKPDSSGDGG